MKQHHPVIMSIYNSVSKSLVDIDPFAPMSSSSERLNILIKEKTLNLDLELTQRIQEEILGVGPLRPLLENDQVTEIMITAFNQVWFENREGKFEHDDHFMSVESFEKFVFRFCHDRNIQLSFEYPFAEFGDGLHRWTFIYGQVARGNFQVCIRRKTKSEWSLNSLGENGFCNELEKETLRQIMLNRQNYLVIGATGSGKTTLLNALIKEVPNSERIVILEDTEELHVPNSISCAMVCRKEIKNQFGEVSLQDLLKASLRLRPDRLVVGEVRGAEAKDLLLALSTGHEGSLATLHAESAAQALIRLEMLIQMGAPQWSIESIRRLIHLSIHGIIVVGHSKQKEKNGQRCLRSIHKIHSLESTGFILEAILEKALHHAEVPSPLNPRSPFGKAHPHQQTPLSFS